MTIMIPQLKLCYIYYTVYTVYCTSVHTVCTAVHTVYTGLYGDMGTQTCVLVHLCTQNRTQKFLFTDYTDHRSPITDHPRIISLNYTRVPRPLIFHSHDTVALALHRFLCTGVALYTLALP